MIKAILHIIRDKGFVLFLLLLSSCSVKDDIPFPIIEGNIMSIGVEGQCNEDDSGYGPATINKDKRTVDVWVSDTVDVSRLRIDSLRVNEGATIQPDPERCLAVDAFPTHSFNSRTAGVDSRIDFSGDSCRFVISTYQDYDWTVRVHQVIRREVRLTGQVGDPVIDAANRTAIIYVARGNALSSLKASKFSLGGQNGSVTPDPTATDTYDFSSMRQFSVFSRATGRTENWRVYVYKTDNAEVTKAEAFAHSAAAYITGEVPTGTEPVVEYHSDNTTEWTTVNPAQITQKGRNFTAAITGLRSETKYTYRVTGGSTQTDELTFTTAGTRQLENAGFERWSASKGSSGKELLQPWGEGETPFWSTGNAGATTVGASNSTYADEGGNRYANLQSKFIVIKFAAGNIFTGAYLQTDGSNGILGFGRPFTVFPTKLRFEYKFHTSTINKMGDWSPYYTKYMSQEFFESLKGKPDSCSVYVALIGDKDEEEYKGVIYPFIIRTRPSTLHLFDPNSDNVIAYGQFTRGDNVDEWTTETININYRVTNRQPKYIIVVASSSKFGDYFIGGAGNDSGTEPGSLLQIDNIELLYE